MPSAGSSPHTWGIHAGCTGSPLGRRFIPTYVGHTRARTLQRRRDAVHPHIRGAYVWKFPIVVIDERFIPTYVGHTPTTTGRRVLLAVHPHIRGAYDNKKFNTLVDERFIPTYVGHTRVV